MVGRNQEYGKALPALFDLITAEFDHLIAPKE